MRRNWKRGRGQYKHCYPDSSERAPPDHERYSTHRSFSRGKEVECSDQEFQSLHSQRKFQNPTYSQHRSHSSRYRSADYNPDNYPNKMASNNNNFEPYAPSDDNENEPMSILDETNSFFERLRKQKPSEFIIEYRKKIDFLLEQSTKKNLENVERMHAYRQQGTQSDIFQAHVQNLHLQREEFENFVKSAKQKLSSLLSCDMYEILQKGDLILESVKSECKLFDKVLPGYSLKSSLISKLNDNRVIIVSSDSMYYLNVVFPILLKKEYPNHLLLSCEANEILSSSLKINVNNLCPKSGKLDGKENNIRFFTAEELLNFILKDPKLVNREKDFISICRLPLKRTIIVDMLLAKLKDVLEDQQDSKLILLLSSCDKSLKYESYFSDYEVDIIMPPCLTFPVSTVWKKSPLLPTDDYIDDVVKTIVSIHSLNEDGDIMVFLPSIPDIQSASVALRAKLNSLSFTDLDLALLHENRTQPEQMKWLNMCYQKQTKHRVVFLVTDCAESFVIPSVSYVIDCGLKREPFYDHSKKLDVLTTHFISCDRAKLLKKIAGALASNAVCYRLYSKENFCDEMPASECPEILTIDPFNALIKVYQYEPYSAAAIEFVENLPSETKSRTLNLLKKSNAIKDNKLTKLGERIIKLPFPPLYSKVISVGIEWELGFEAVILVAFLSVKGRIFKYFNDAELQRKVDAVKCQLNQNDSDTISYLYIYKLWLENNSSVSWCDKMYLNSDTLKHVHVKVGEISQIVEDNLKKNIIREFKDEDVTSSLLDLLFECFKMNLCVFTGHHRSGYRMLSSRCVSFLHPSSILCQTEKLPEFIIFDHMISTTRDFLVNITAIPNDIIMSALTTEQLLDFDYSDMFENTLVEKVIEPVGERIIKQVLLGKKGRKLKETENKIKATLSDESIVIDPSIEKGRISVFASEACIDEAVRVLEDVIKQENENLLNSEETHLLKMINGNVVIPVELKWLKGGIIKSLMVKHNSTTESQDSLGDKKQADSVPYSIKKSININFIRRKCRDVALVKFSPKHFAFARKYAMRSINLLGVEVFVSVDQNNILALSNLPADARLNEVESELRKLLPPHIEFERVELKYEPPFETSSNDLLIIKQKIEDVCSKHTKLVDFRVVVNMPKPSATLIKVYLNVSNDEDIVSASDELSNNLKFQKLFGVQCTPNFSTVIKSSLKIINALEPRFEEKLTELGEMVKERFGHNGLFKFDIFPFDDQICTLKMASSNYEILQALQRTIYSLLEGDVLNHNFNKDIGKLLCHGGLLRLKTLEESSGVHIVCEYKTKSLRLFGSTKKCHLVKQQILQFILEIETETAKEISLATKSNNRILLKTLLVQYGADLENFIGSCGLRLAVLNFKSCTLTLHGNEESIIKAEFILKELASSIDLNNFSDVLEDEEVCPVCVCRAQNLTHRLEMCGHLYCFECLQALVLQAQFPIKCCLEGCTKELILDDISKALEYDQAKLDALLKKSMEKYLEDHREEYIYCPGPDCSMFFNKNGFSESKHTCSLCLNDICIKCNVVYHQGFSCEMYQGSKNDPDYSFKIWQKESSECKQCPNCNTAIQKDGGCDHMTCRTCHSHFCWVCVQEFPDANAVYKHIPFCPKHPKW